MTIRASAGLYSRDRTTVLSWLNPGPGFFRFLRVQSVRVSHYARATSLLPFSGSRRSAPKYAGPGLTAAVSNLTGNPTPLAPKSGSLKAMGTDATGGFGVTTGASSCFPGLCLLASALDVAANGEGLALPLAVRGRLPGGEGLSLMRWGRGRDQDCDPSSNCAFDWSVSAATKLLWRA